MLAYLQSRCYFYLSDRVSLYLVTLMIIVWNSANVCVFECFWAWCDENNSVVDRYYPVNRALVEQVFSELYLMVPER